MEMKEADRVVIAKPVASRPSCSSFRSFSELLAGAINASPSNVCTETTFAPIRPKTVRFKTTKKGAPAGLVSPQADINATAVCNSSDKVSESDSKPIVVYKPLAKLVSKTTFSLLANMGNFQTSQCSHQQTLQSIGAPVKHQNHDKQNFRFPFSSNLQIPSRAETDEAIEASKTALQNLEDDPRTSILTNHVDRPSFDGYNWRKYGQKQVKGSEYPRSYYKCTHPNCPVKKKVERSFDGQIAEIVYKGEHNHLKPQPQKRNSSGTQVLGLGFVPDQTGQVAGNPNESSEGRVENRNELGFPADSIYRNNAPVGKDFVMSGEINGGTPENSCGVSGECEEGSKGMEVEDDEHRSKRRKSENQSNEARISGEGVGGQEARIAVQSSTDSEILGDGFRWRKYGQKVVKGNPYPRSYYRCTSLKCNVRKHVERTSDDPKAFITTYEGKHNHGMPLKNTNTNSAASEPDSCKEKP